MTDFSVAGPFPTPSGDNAPYIVRLSNTTALFVHTNAAGDGMAMYIATVSPSGPVFGSLINVPGYGSDIATSGNNVVQAAFPIGNGRVAVEWRPPQGTGLLNNGAADLPASAVTVVEDDGFGTPAYGDYVYIQTQIPTTTKWEVGACRWDLDSGVFVAFGPTGVSTNDGKFTGLDVGQITVAGDLTLTLSRATVVDLTVAGGTSGWASKIPEPWVNSNSRALVDWSRSGTSPNARTYAIDLPGLTSPSDQASDWLFTDDTDGYGEPGPFTLHTNNVTGDYDIVKTDNVGNIVLTSTTDFAFNFDQFTDMDPSTLVVVTFPADTVITFYSKTTLAELTDPAPVTVPDGGSVNVLAMLTSDLGILVGYGDYAYVIYRESTPTPIPTPDVLGQGAGELGCGEYRVVIMDRCGRIPVCDITESISDIEGSPFRVMDDTSQVIITVDLTGTEGNACCACLGATRSWIHNVVIERNGEVVWGPGPIVNILYKREQVVVTARDVSAWLDRRVIHQDYVFYQETVSSVVRTLLEDALSPNDPCGLIGYLSIKPTSTLIDKEVVAHEGTAGDVLRDMARNYLDFTVVGQQIVITEELTYGPFTRLGDEDFQNELEIEERGLEAATKWYVEGAGVEGTCGGTDPYYGLLEQVATEDTLLDETTTNAAACSRLKASNPAPVYINIPEDSQLSARAHVTFEQLIPGTLIDVALTDVCRPLYARNRLTSMSIKVTGDGTEAVGITLSPLGTTTGGATTE